MVEIITKSVEETEQLGEKIGAALKGDEVLALYGGLGMGKTAFTRGIARAFGCEDGVSSPTFAIVNEYEASKTIYHYDMYRVTSWDDLYSTGFFDYIGNGIIIIEWSENIENAIPDTAIRINIECLDDTVRKFTIEGDVDL